MNPIKARPCAECGTGFTPKREHGRFCAEECKDKARVKRRERPAPVKIAARPCAECGNNFVPRQWNGRFCTRPCMTRYNNRRYRRGAQLYDWTMIKRYQREHESEARGIVDRLCRAYRDSDKTNRDGRPSWQPIGVARDEVPMAYSDGGDGR